MSASLRAEPPIVCFPFVGDLIGGSHISAIGLIKGIDRRCYRPLVLLQNDRGELADLFRREDIHAEVAPLTVDLPHGQRVGLGKVAGIVRSTLAQARFLRSRGVRIVHSNDGRTHATWGLAARAAGARLIWHHRGDPDAFGLRFVAPWQANRVVAVSRFAAPRPGLLSAAKRCHVIHSPFAVDTTVDRRAARAAVLAELGCPADTRIIGFFGALIPRKRPLLFVDAIAALRSRYPEKLAIGLVFGGAVEIAEAAILARANAAGIGDHVRCMGFRYPAERWLAGCDLLMVPAVDEPFGRTLIEAMMLGTPVVAAASGGNVEAIEHGVNGLLVPPEDAGALAQAAVALLDDPAYARVPATARERALRQYRPEAHAAAIMQIYDELLAGPGRRSAAPPAPHWAPR